MPRSSERRSVTRASKRKKESMINRTSKKDAYQSVMSAGQNPTAQVCSCVKKTGSAVLRSIVRSFLVSAATALNTSEPVVTLGTTEK